MLESLDNEMARLQLMLKDPSQTVPATVISGSQKRYIRTLAKVFSSDRWLSFG
jgi:endonuclease YncB( thermonuclease family)